MLGSPDHTLFPGILPDQVLGGFFHAWPDADKESILGGHLVLAQRPQDVHGLGINGGLSLILAAAVDQSLGCQGRPEVDLFALFPFDRGEEACDRLGIAVDMATGSLAGTDPFPGPPPPVPESVVGRGCQIIDGENRPFEEPPWEGRVIPGVVP